MHSLHKKQNPIKLNGANLCTRFAYPPNSLSLCGPDKKSDLLYSSSLVQIDSGTLEILQQFTTLYPYLSLIAYHNNIRDTFDTRVVEAYWIGNSLLNNISQSELFFHLTDTLKLKKKLKIKNYRSLLDKISFGTIPHHSFHVLNIYKRTGHVTDSHTVKTMDACLINWGKVVKLNKNSILVETKPLSIINNRLDLGPKVIRQINPQGEKDILFKKLKTEDYVSYHWGYFCQKLCPDQLRNLIYYTKLSLSLSNL